MCGRFTRYLSWAEIHRLYRLTAPADTGRNTEPRYNIAPTVLFVTAGDDGSHKLREGRWWLVPWWAKEMPKAATFNARIETVGTPGAFKDASRSTRCLIPADGFYEFDGELQFHRVSRAVNSTRSSRQRRHDRVGQPDLSEKNS